MWLSGNTSKIPQVIIKLFKKEQIVKKIQFLFLLMALTATTQAYAAEGVVAEPASALNIQDASASTFRIVVTASQKLIIKPGAVFTEGNEPGTEMPFLLDNPKPISYPSWAVAEGLQGELTIAIEIKEDGSVGLYQVMQSTGFKILDESAVEAVQNWKFHPAVKDGKPTRICIQIPIRFQAEED